MAHLKKLPSNVEIISFALFRQNLILLILKFKLKF